MTYKKKQFVNLTAAAVLVISSGCTVPPPPAVRPQPGPAPAASWRAVGLIVRGVAGASCSLQDVPGWTPPVVTNADGYLAWLTVTGGLRQTAIRCHTEGYLDYEAPAVLATDQDEDLPAIALQADHVDPSTFSLDDLKGRLRGSLSVRLNLPYGPRPNQDSNIAWMAFYELYTKPNRDRMLEAFRTRGLTMSAIGPVTGNDCYHEQFPNTGDAPTGGLLPGCLHNWRVPTQVEWDAYLDGVQEQWDRDLMPCYFAKPDGWERADYAAEMDTLDALYRQPRAQQLLRCVIYPGWEPSGAKYGWPNREYVRWVQRGAAVFPHALRGLHTVSDLDAPTGQDDDRTFPPGQGNALSWVNVAPYIHFWADQLGGYVNDGVEQPSAHFLDELCKHAQRVRDGFRGGFGWPSTGADGTPIRHIVFEFAAFVDWWKNFDERYSWQIGDAAMRCGADGYGDGGTVPVRR